MAGVTNIQVMAMLQFSDGFVITMSTPVWSRDADDGEFFDQALTEEVITHSGEALAGIVEHEGLKKLHGAALAGADAQLDKRRPGSTDLFSLN